MTVKRPPRAYPPPVPDQPVELVPPPELPRSGSEDWMMSLLPLLGMGGSAAFFFSPGAQGPMKMMGVLMVASTAAMAVAQIVRARKGGSAGTADERRDYLKYLQQKRREVRRTAERQRGALLFTHPEPDQLWSIVAEGRRLWERRPSDPDFAQIRVGQGPLQLSTPLVAPQTAPMDELEPLCAEAMGTFIKTHGTLQDLPLAVSLRAFYHITVCGDPDSVYGNVRAMLAQLATLHSPEDLMIAVAAAPGAVDEWEWAKWLPHTQHRKENDGAGSRRLIATELGDLEELLANELAGRKGFSRDSVPTPDQPHIVVIMDGAGVPHDSLLAGAEGVQGVTVIEVVPGDLDEPNGHLVVTVGKNELLLEAASGASYPGKPDTLSGWQSEALARQLAPFRASAGGDDGDPSLVSMDFTEMMHTGDPGSFDPARHWRPKPIAEKLKVPLGVGQNGEYVWLDIKEASLQGMGPHGMCVGATGSGKSEVLRTIVLALAVTHSSEVLNLVLADFKGGATFAGMAEMPHTAAVITNLEGEATLIDRMRDAIEGEMNRRQELLRAAGNYANINEYERARAAGAALDPLPSLLMIIDEFSELLTAKPDFIDLFIQIGRIGRSLGMHMLLASQRLEEGKLRGLDTFLSYRLGLRTFSAAESRAAIGVPDAYHLPPIPGVGYLKFGSDVMERFRAAYVSGPYRPPGQQRAIGGRTVTVQPVLFTASEVPVIEPVIEEVVEEAPEIDDSLLDTMLDVFVQRMIGQGPPAHQVWLPPLEAAPSIDQLVPPLQVTADRGLTSPHGKNGGLVVPVGIVDKPRDQRRDIMELDYSGAAGHGLIVGGPRSGKSTLVRTMVAGFAVTHTPVETQFYLLDFGGGGFGSLADLPHVGGVAGRLDVEKVRRMISEVHGVLNRREELFRAAGIDTITTYRTRRAAGQLPDEQFGDVFLLIDGWLTFKQEFEVLEPVIADIAQRGLGYGVHVIVTAARYAEVRPALKDLLQNRVELKLGDSMESEIDRKVAVNVPPVPGRGLTTGKLHFLSGLPRLDGASTTEDLVDGVTDLVAQINAAWTGPRAPQVRMLPAVLDGQSLPKGFEHPELGVAFGVDEVELAPVFVNFETDPLFVVFGESESGKSAMLRMLIKQITERYTPDQAGIVVGDFRRSLLGVVPPEYLVEYAAAAPAMSQIVEMLRGACSRRLPGPDVTPEQLRNRSWYSGKDMFVVVDDYELVATQSGNPMAPLAEFLPFARDIGLRIVIARNSGGAGRSLFEPVMQRMRELGGQGILLSGDKNEGALLGTVKPQPLPPGRGVFVSRRIAAGQTVQTGWLPTP
ncbi:S-DNA-T family DNA segregation ATPase FtsK/SpoIIIE [Kitasatospora paracochleata]|uniref:S-DNA-T family DNA segregation ATPase FtsK/SpoIIIE n=1 Tax=Kitasatospora paracochleata TaxID=58354 RepID=A0ABT1IYT1_9ACTN|nr:S-DNA-T family DNA segregation ATPase FtsK/SpoIIIE [Kitasatospora paracochleata]